MRTIDMRLEDLPAQSWLSPTLTSEVARRVNAGEQALLFLNRRGYAPVTLCRACGAQVGCDHCDARMVEHRFLKRLVCHQCGETKPLPETCPVCGVEGKMAAVGPGVERVAEEATAAFPDAKIAVLSSDLFGSARALKAQIEEIAEGDTDIIIGTQLVAKGHNFPRLTLVGVVDADLGLQGGDLRAAERTFQLMRQVSGRAGRAEKPGLAHAADLSARASGDPRDPDGDEEAFWRAEAAEREAAGMPPYGRLAGIIISAGDAASAFDLGQHLARNDEAIRAAGGIVYGPAPAPIARVRGRHRVRLLVKAPKGAALQGAITRWMSGLKLPSQVRLAVDIDPQSFY
jgi:primosomal protein N' (replication factor Y) (superfamily II helicase)